LTSKPGGTTPSKHPTGVADAPGASTDLTNVAKPVPTVLVIVVSTKIHAPDAGKSEKAAHPSV